jgi:GNAT superfamily N-acetyltransferase
MGYTIEPFTYDFLEPVVEIFTENYKNERENNPLLPSRAIDEPRWILDNLKSLASNPGVIVRSGKRIIAYMLTGFLFPFKGQNAVQVPVYCHGSIAADRAELYRIMYMRLAEEWAKEGRHLHIIGHFAHDSVLQETLFQLGFGAILAECLRDFSPAGDIPELEIIQEKDFIKLIDIQIEHMRYYPASPIFIRKDTDRESVISDLESHANKGDVFLVYYEHDEPAAYFIVGTSAATGEGFLLQNTGTAQIKGTYARPYVRGRGIGKALLQDAIDWSREHGYDRLFVEHETANYYGGNFWRKHFTPYMYFSMRYIDNAI